MKNTFCLQCEKFIMVEKHCAAIVVLRLVACRIVFRAFAPLNQTWIDTRFVCRDVKLNRNKQSKQK